MTKKRARVGFILLSIFTVIGILLSVCSFKIPFTDYVYNGFANSISLGLDLSGGISAVYDCSLSKDSGTKDLSSAVDGTITRLETILYGEGYSEATVSRQGGNKIRIEVPNLTDSQDLFNLIGKPASLYISTNSEFNVNNPSGDYVSGNDIDNVYVSYNSQDSCYGVVLKFTETGSDQFSKITKAAAEGEKTLYINIGDEEALKVTCEQQMTQGSTFVYGGSIQDYDSAKEYSMMIMSGTFSASLELVECSVVSATLGKNALLYGIIAGAVAMALVMLIMWWRYGRLGLLADFSLVIYMVLMMFFLQAIPFIQLTLPGIAGIILSIGMAVDGNIIILERIREEYATGKKIPLAVKGGFKKAFWPIFDSNITTILTSIILYILGTASIKGFALTLLLGILLSMFSTLVMTRILVKWALPFNANKPDKFKLKRKKNIVEISENEDNNDSSNNPEIVVEG
jgi:preprotein translocase subunit SecD